MLQAYREQIDDLDAKLVEMMNQRAQLAQAIGKLKAGSVYHPGRELEILHHLQQINSGPLSHQAIALTFKELISACRELQDVLTISYLGPPGTFSQAAVFAHFGHGVKLHDCSSIDEVFRSVVLKQVQLAVVPVENSTEGAVNKTLDLLTTTDLRIVGEIVLPIRQQLLRKTSTLEGLEKIYSHPQSLAQCNQWLNSQVPNVQRIPVESNAQGARLAAEDATAAAIAGEVAAELYQLQVVAADIQDDINNTTRFLILGHLDSAPTGQDKTSLVVAIKNRSGALVDLLTPLFRYNVSMTKLESRPAHTALWEYLFFIDVEGHERDPNVASAITEMAQQSIFIKILGSYPKYE